MAMSCGLADGRQEPRHVALEASDQPIMQPIGGIAKQAGFAERRYSDQLHGSDRDLRCAFVSIHVHMLDRPASSKYQLSTLIHPDEEMLAGVPRERRRQGLSFNVQTVFRHSVVTLISDGVQTS